MPEESKLLYCSFCGKAKHEVVKLIAGPRVFICNECTDLCIAVILEEVAENTIEHKNMPTLESLIRETPNKDI